MNGRNDEMVKYNLSAEDVRNKETGLIFLAK